MKVKNTTMTSQKNYNYLIDLIGGVWVENNGTQHLKIKDKPYDITFNPRVLEWTCTCPGYIFRRGKHCKHIKHFQEKKLWLSKR